MDFGKAAYSIKLQVNGTFKSAIRLQVLQVDNTCKINLYYFFFYIDFLISVERRLASKDRSESLLIFVKYLMMKSKKRSNIYLPNSKDKDILQVLK